MNSWLLWQGGNIGFMAGRLSDFRTYPLGEHPYLFDRNAAEYRRCLEVLERRLAGRDYILNDYGIADMAS